MRSVTALAFLLLCALIGTRTAYAAEPPPEAPLPRFEVTPFLGYRFGGDLEIFGSGEPAHVHDDSVGAIAFSMRYEDRLQLGLFYSRQFTTTHSYSGAGSVGTDIEYIHLDGTMTGQYFSLFYPYLIGAVGMTRLSVREPDTRDNTRFSIAVGAGARVPVRSRLDVRLETRGYLTFIDTSSSVFCSSGAVGGACALRARGSAFLQYDILLGVAFGF